MSQEISSYLECSVCFQGYTDNPERTPRSLICGHTFCTSCLQQLTTKNEVTCPTCRQKQTFSQGVTECNKNFALLELLGKLKSPEVVCAECEKHKATIWCSGCELSHCKNCSSILHKFKSLRHHKRAKLEDKPVNVVCKEHQERYHFFCSDCNVPICYICKDRDHGKHGNHTSQLLINAGLEKREILEDRRSALENVVKSLESKSLKVAATSKLVSKNESKHVKEILESRKALIQIINKRCEELTNQVRNMAAEKTTTLFKHRSELGTSLTAVTALIEESNQLLNSDTLKLLLEVKDLVVKLDNSIDSSTEISVKPITSSYIGCSLDKTDVIKAVQRFGGIGVPNIPENLTTSTISSTSAEISWNSSSLSSVPQNSFVLQHCEQEEKTTDWKSVKLSKDKTKTLITNFQPNTSYNIRICASNHVGRGQWSEEIKLKTKPTPPSPESLTCSNITAASAKVHWKPPKLSPLAPGDSYVVQYGEDEEGKGSLKDIEVSQQKTSAILDNLTPNTYNLVRVCAYNKFGRGNWTSDVKFKTKNIPKPFVTSSNISRNSVDISWTLQNVSDFSYDVQYGEEVKNSGPTDFVISKGTTTRTLTGLSEGMAYSLRVRAVISKARGEWSTDIKFTTERGFKGTTLIDATSAAKLQEFLGGLKTGKLLYKASLHGFGGSTFHQRCDDKGPTLFVVKMNDSSTIYGGYTPLSWDSSNSPKTDNQLRSFVFTMSNDKGKPEKFQHKAQHEQAIFCHSSYGPTFGCGNAICIGDNSNTTTNNHTNTSSTYGVPTNSTLCGQHSGYTIDDYEVFSVN